MEVISIGLDKIRPSNNQPDGRGNDVTALAASIKAIGVINPIHVAPAKGKGKHEIIAGERRWRAAKEAGLDSIPAIILKEDKATQQVIRISENVHRRDLTPLEEAEAIEILLNMNRSFEEIAADLAMSATTVARRARLLTLIPKWRKQINDLPASSLELIARYDKARQKALHERFGDYLPETDRLKTMLAEDDRLLSHAPWKMDDAGLYPKAGACKACEKRSDCQATLLLFHDDPVKAPKAARCLDSGCWDVKLQQFIKWRKNDIEAKHGKPVEVTTLNTGTDREDVLRPWEYGEVKAKDKGARPAIIVGGPRAGHMTWIRKARSDEPTRQRSKPKMANLSPAERTKARKERLLGRRSMHVVKALQEAFDKAQGLPVLREMASTARERVMLHLAIAFGIKANVYYRDVADSGTWPGFTKHMSDGPEEMFDRWAKSVHDPIRQSLWAIRRIDEARVNLPHLLFLAETMLGLKMADLKAAAVEAIPNRQLAKGEVDTFEPGRRAAKTPKSKPKAKGKKKGSGKKV